MPKDACQTCEGEKDVRALQCGKCRMRDNSPRKGSGRRPDGMSVNKRGYLNARIGGVLKLEHRMVMEAAIGRQLRRDEHVHHKNGVKTDNRIENLEVLTAPEHHREHMTPERAKAMSIKAHQVRWGGQNSDTRS